MTTSLDRRRRHPRPGPMLSTYEAPAEAETRAVAGEELWWPPGGGAGVVVTEQTALTMAAVLAMAVTIATDTAVLPLRVHQHMPDGSSREATEHGNHEILARSPDGEATPVRWRQSWMGHALLYGSGYAEIRRTGDARPYSLHLLDPGSTKTTRVDGRLTYQINNGRSIPASDVLHIAGLGFDGISGYNMVRLLRQAIGLGIAEETYAADFFSNGSESGGTIEIPGRLQDDAAVTRLVNRWEGRHGSAGKRHRVAVLEEGAKYNPTSTEPEKSQLLESRKFQVLETIRPWRLPPNKAGDYSQAHLANIEASNLDYLMTCLMGWLVVVEQECDLKLFSRKEWAAGYRVRHDVTALLRGDLASRFASYKSALGDGWMNRNEVRRRENLDPISADKGGDAYTVQMQVVALGPDGAKTPEPKAPPTPPPAPKPDESRSDPALDAESRFNKHHGKDGQFASATHGGTGGIAKAVVPAPHGVDDSIDVKRRAFEDGVEHLVAKVTGGTHVTGQKPRDVDVDRLDGRPGVHRIEVKSKSYGGKQVLSVHPNAKLLKIDAAAANPKDVWHTVAVDARHDSEGGSHRDHYSGHELYYKRAVDAYPLSKMHKVKDVDELNRLIHAPAGKLPLAARGSFSKDPAVLASLRETAARDKAYNDARSKESKAKHAAMGTTPYRRKTQLNNSTVAVSSG